MYLPFRIDPLRLRHALKTGIACLLGWIVMHAYHAENGQWILITIIVVMSAQLNVGGLVQKASLRFLGTLCGATVALLVLAVFGANPVVSVVVILLAVIGFTYIASNPAPISYLGTLGAVTTVIILLGREPNIATGIARVSEISVGIAISLVVSVFIFPLHAATLLQENIASMLLSLQALYKLSFSENLHPVSYPAFTETEERIRQQFVTHRGLKQEASREFGEKRFSSQQLHDIEQSIRESMRGILHIHHNLGALPPTVLDFFSSDFFIQINAALDKMFTTLVIAASQGQDQKIVLPENPEQIALILQSKTTPLMHALTSQHRQCLYVFLSAEDEVLRGIEKLAVLLGVGMKK